jgi:predicted phosphoribosyltransferase
MMSTLFRDRADAGRRLAARLAPYAGRRGLLVLALPRGGVPVAGEIAERLGAPLDLFIVRKLGVPGQPELAMGAIASGGVRVMNDDVVKLLAIPAEKIERVAEKEEKEIERREREYGDGRPFPDIAGRTIILVDDGLATGATMLAAVQALEGMGPAAIIVAVPVASTETCEQFRDEVDEVICLHTPTPFHGVGMWYEDFSQTTDQEVRDIVRRAMQGDHSGGDGR